LVKTGVDFAADNSKLVCAIC